METEGAAAQGPSVVGIGASAGGLEALQRFVGAIPVDSGLAYVVVQHLSPDHDSILVQLLQARTKLTVLTASDGQVLAPDTIYVGPPTEEIRFDAGRIDASPRGEAIGPRAPIDAFFASLADGLGRDAYCVVLSGTGSDGSAGLKAVKAAGGVAMAQDSAGARFPGMPNAAVATGLVDLVLRAEDMPGRLVEIARHREGFSQKTRRDALHAEIEAALPRITGVLTERGGHDFAGYKPGTLVRRIERRMSLRRVQRTDSFVDLLLADEEEAARLSQDFLIGVTRFFRDEEAFAALEERVIAPLLRSDRPSFRVWVPGCSTGEEAYTIAMSFLDAMKATGDDRRLQVFGTDIDVPALTHARVGLYAGSAAGHLPSRYRAAYFAEEGDGLRASPRLREVCVFAPHNLLRDPPFSKLDLVSCRNLLIYLDLEAQRKVMARFHFSLQDDGAMLLGPSESVAGQEHFFRTIDAEHRLFRRDGATPTRYSPLSDERPRVRRGGLGTLPPPIDLAEGEVSREAQADRAFLNRFAAPYALITRRGEVRYLSERMTDYVKPARGVPSTDIDTYLARELRVPLRSALSQLPDAAATEPSEEIRIENVFTGDEDDPRFVDVTVAPLPSDPDLALVVLTEVRHAAADELSGLAGRGGIQDRDLLDRDLLEREVVSLRRQLKGVTAEFDTSSQELRSTNEELLSMNEELQSSNEELETSREELQSINEELETVNAELGENNAQLTRVNSDLKNLFESTDVAVLFLDSQLCVRSFTPSATTLFGIKERDQGRPITDLSSRATYPELTEDAATVGRTLQALEREVEVEETGETFILRMRPYRTTDDRLDGLVLTFFDITQRKTTELTLAENQRDLARQYAELETLYDTTPVGLSLMDREMRWVRINEELAAINGFPIAQHIGMKQSDLIPDIDEKILATQKQVFETGEAVRGIEVTGETPADPGVTRHWIVDYYPVGNADGVFAVGCCVREVTEQKSLQLRLTDSEAQLRRTLDGINSFAAVLEPDGTIKEVNAVGMATILPEGRSVVGEKAWDMPGWNADAERRGWLRDAVASAGAGETVRSEVAIDDGAGDRLILDVQLAPSLAEEGEVLEIVASAFDVTARKRAETQLVTLLGELQHRVKNTLATVAAVARFLADGAEGAEDVDAYLRRLEARLGAISRTHDVLTSTDWRDADLAEVVRAEAAPYVTADMPRVVLTGGTMRLAPDEVISLGMAIHELMTNSAKYGALSVREGRVEVEVSDGGGAAWTQLPRTITWRERGGPPVIPPTREGFGSFLIERVLAADLKGEATLRFEPDGLRCLIALPAR